MLRISLSKSQIAQGVEACFRQAAYLKRQAEKLNGDPDSVPLVLACAAIRVEELAKVKLFNDVGDALPDDADRWKRFWKRFRRHDEKWLASFEQSLVHVGTTYEEIEPMLDEEVKTRLEELISDFKSESQTKNDAFYVDYDPNIGRFVTPLETEGLAASTGALLKMGDILEITLRDVISER